MNMETLLKCKQQESFGLMMRIYLKQLSMDGNFKTLVLLMLCI